MCVSCRGKRIIWKYAFSAVCAFCSAASILYVCEDAGASLSGLFDSLSAGKAVFAAVFLLLSYVYFKVWFTGERNKRIVAGGIICGAVMGVCQAVGEIAEKYSEVVLGQQPLFSILFYLLSIFTFTILLFCLKYIIFRCGCVLKYCSVVFSCILS